MFTLEELQTILNIVANAPISYLQAAPLVAKIQAEAQAITPVMPPEEALNSGSVSMG
jgi:hypothetical protein